MADERVGSVVLDLFAGAFSAATRGNLTSRGIF